MSNSIQKFRQLHDQDTTLLPLPNAWDAASARLFESVGAKAIATTSAGVAWSLGYPDGNAMPVDVAIAAAGRMARVLDVPLSVDMENGYSDNPTVVAENIVRLAKLGVAGINIEDGTGSTQLMATKISAIRDAITKAGLDLFINARSDVYLAQLVPKEALVDESVARAQLYAAAGADGFFLPGVFDETDIRRVVEAITLPLNVMAWPSLPDAARLVELGVKRLSAGSGISQIVWATAEKHAKDFLRDGQSHPFTIRMPYPTLQELFAAKLGEKPVQPNNPEDILTWI